MPDAITVTVDGAAVPVSPGTTALAAILIAGKSSVRRSVAGSPRGPLCAMGVCFECRAVVNRTPHSRTCQILCVPGMDIRTQESTDG